MNALINEEGTEEHLASEDEADEGPSIRFKHDVAEQVTAPLLASTSPVL